MSALAAVRRRIGPRLVPAGGVLLLLIVWQLVGVLEVSPAVPRVDDVFAAFAEIMQQPRFHEAVVNTAIAIAIAFPIATVSGVVVGALMGQFRVVEWALMPYLYLALSVPLIVVIPVILLIFGLGRTSIVVVVVVYVVPMIVANTMAGVQSVDAALREMSWAFGANRRLTFRRVVAPTALALIMSGLRIGAGRAIEGAVLAEQIVGLLGLGGLVMRLGGAFAVEELFAVVIFIGLVGVTTVSLLNRLERRLNPMQLVEQ